MDLKELKPPERLALVALLQHCALSDGQLSLGEEAELAQVVAALGEADYQLAAAAVSKQVHDLADLKNLLSQVTSQDARALIYGTLLQVASHETIDGTESQLLGLVEEAWHMLPTFEDFPSEDEP